MRILIADDHELVRKGVRSVLTARNDFEICGEAVDGQDAVEQARQLSPELIVMDVSMPRLNGLEATRAIRQFLPHTDILILSQHDSPEMMRQALNAGARGYVIKSSISAELIDSIVKVRCGQLAFDPAASNGQSNIDVHEIMQRNQAFERALRDSEERFRLTFEQAAVGMAHAGENGEWLRVNQKLCEIVGYKQKELLKLKFQDITHPDDLRKDLELSEKIIRGELDQYSMQKRYIRKDGVVIWANLTVSSVRDLDCQLKYFISVVEDITARKKAEDRQDETARVQKALFHLADELLRSTAMDEIYSAAFNAIFASLQCDRASILLTDEAGVMHFASWRGLSKRYRQATDGHSAWAADDSDPQPICVSNATAHNFDEHLKEAIGLEGIGSLCFVPLVSNGKLIGKFMTYFNQPHRYSRHEIDLSLTIARQLAFGVERKRTEDNLRGSEARFRALSETLRIAQTAANVGTWEWDPITNTRRLSPELHKIFGLDPEDPNRYNVWASRVHADDWDQVQKRMADLQDSGNMEFEYRYNHPENGLRWFYCKGSKVGDQAAFGVVLDVTLRKQVEEALREREQHLLAIVETTPECVKLVSKDGTLLRMNAAGLSMVGADSAETVLGKNVYSLIAPEDLERFREFNERVCNGEKGTLAFDIVGLNGRRRHMETHAAPLRQTDGSYCQLAVTRDITDRSSSDQATNLLAAIVDSSDDAIISKDLNGVITSWNKSAQRLFGYTAEEAIGRSIASILIPPDRQDEEVDILSRLRRGERVDHFDTVRMRKDGTLIDVSVTISPVKDSTGRVVGASKVARDITERRLASQREREISAEAVAAKAKFKALFEQTTVFAGIMSSDGVLLEANNLSLEACGYTSEQVVGRQFWQTAWWRNFPESQQKIKAATLLASQGITFHEELMYSWADGSEHIVDFGLLPIRDPEGKVLFLHPTGVDITDLKRVQNSYQKLVESLDAEVRDRTKELEERNADVVRQSKRLREMAWHLLHTQDEERRHLARELHDSAGQTLAVLSMNLSAIARSVRQKAPDIAEIADETELMVENLSKEIRTTSYLLHPPLLDETGLPAALEWYIHGLKERSDLEMTLDVSDDFGRLQPGAELAIFRLVQECLTNIHRHSGSKTAAIRIAREQERVLVEIRDQGHGIAAEKLAEIKTRGSGVGIRGIRERLKEFDGEMNIQSNSAGTTISVSIPLSKEATAQDTVSSDPIANIEPVVIEEPSNGSPGSTTMQALEPSHSPRRLSAN
jgi:PAS domain S-box-containing protein